MPPHPAPETKSPTEPGDLQRKAAAYLDGSRPVDARYPYVVPDYQVPFLHLGTRKQLFIDNFILDQLEGVQRRVVTPRKTAQPLIGYDDLPWERVQFNPGIAAALQDPDDGLFKMWYWQGTTGHVFNEGQVLCYAESENAVDWVKPLRSDCRPFQDHTRTNIVHGDVSQLGVALNHDRSDPSRKYLLLNWPPQTAHGQTGTTRLSQVEASPDGIRWHRISAASTHPHHHEQKIFWDRNIERYVAYSQYSHHQNFTSRKRQIGRMESADFIRWSPKEMVLSSDWESDVPPNLEYHDMTVYPVGDQYVGIAAAFMAEPFWQERDGHNWRDQAFTHLLLFTSRDGRRFQRVGGTDPWSRNGPPGSRDYGMSCFCAAPAPLYHRGEMVIPYMANPFKQNWFAHDPPSPVRPQAPFRTEQDAWQARNALQDRQLTRCANGLILRADGWVALEPTYEQGTVLTKQFVFEGDTLWVNCACAYGFLRAEILGPDFAPYPGFGQSDCVPLHATDEDQAWHAMHWASGADLRALWNKPVRIRFHLREVSLYGFRIR